MNIVFAHFNTKLPNFLIENLERTQKIFPHHKIYLIHNSKKYLDIKNIQEYHFDLEKNESVRDLNNLLSHPKEFRKNFWMTSIARFFAVAELQTELEQDLLLVESDVVLSKDFPFEELKNSYQEKIAYPLISQERGVASTIYFGSSINSQIFCEFCLGEAKINSQTTDMLILRRFYESNRNRVFLLPNFVPNKKKMDVSVPKEIFEEVAQGIDKFEGIFDGSDIGWYFFGNNPYNSRGFKTRFSKIDEDFCKPEIYNLKTNKERDFYFLQDKDKDIKIYSLHITNKQKKYFKNPVVDGDIIGESKTTRTLVLNVFLIMSFRAFIRRVNSIIGGGK